MAPPAGSGEPNQGQATELAPLTEAVAEAPKPVETATKKREAVDDHDGLTGFKLLRQVFAGVVVAMISTSVSSGSAAAVMLPQLMSNETDIPLTTLQGTWFATVHFVSASVFATLGGMAVHHLGPRRVLLLQVLPTIAGWLLQALANGFTMLLIGRCLVGSCMGITMSAAQVYRGEMSSPQIRGRLVCIHGLFANLSSIMCYVVGYILPWRWVPAMFIGVFLVPSALGMLLVPESPYWLLGKQRDEEARKSLMKLRGDRAVVEKDLAIITEACKRRHKALTLRELGKEMKKPSVLAPFLTLTALFVLRVMAGIMTVLTYTVVIFQETGSALDAYQSSILLGCVRMFNSVCCVLFVGDRFGRRPLLMFSGIGCTITTLGMAAFLFGRDHAPEWTGWQHISWLPLPLILSYIVAFDFGFARTSWVLHSELFPSHVRAALSGFVILTQFVSSSASVFAFPYIREAFTLAGAFCTFAFFSFLGLLLTIFFIPETKNQRLETIEAFYMERFGGQRVN